MVVNFRRDQIFMDFVRFLIHNCEVLYTWCLRYNIFSTWFLDIRISTYNFAFCYPNLLYIRVFHPNALSYRNSNIPSICRHHEQEREREYGDCVREVKNPSFIPIVFAITGDMGREATIFYRRLLTCCPTRAM